MDLGSVVIATLVASPSGAFSPGPLTLATLAIGSRSGWRGGFFIAMGHMAVELPYVLALFFSMNYIAQLLRGFLGDIITALGVLAILFFATMIIKDSIKGASNRDPGKSIKAANPIVIGALFTGLNTYFLLWWLSIGLGLISMTSSIGVTAIAVMYLSHVWMDYLWLITVAEASRRGLRILKG
ncbi:MAG: LysE family transporter, partial [Desulfurococcaceae archaeon]